MDEDVIVIDDVEPTAAPANPPPRPNGGSYSQRPRRAAAEHSILASRLASTPPPDSHPSMDSTERTTRSSLKSRSNQPKLKLKLSEKTAALAPGSSFLGQYDRELDSDDEDLAFEEQFILRMPPGEDCDKLRKMVAARDVSNDVWFKFKDSRRAVFHIGKSTYSSKLVDLPCIIESQKTVDNKQMFKVADICQMLVVENRIEGDEQLAGQKTFNIDEFIWPHGITPPLHHVRKRRFRKRVNKRTIESVEQEVDRLLEQDEAATQVKYDILENVNLDLSDSEFVERDEPIDAPTPAAGSDVGDGATAVAGEGEGEEEQEEEEDAASDAEIDEELAAELDQALNDENDEEEEDESEEEDSEEEESEDENAQARSLLNEEIHDLEAAVAKKSNEVASSGNPLIKKRFADALKKLTADLEMKLAQRDEQRQMQRLKKQGISPDDPDAAMMDPANDGDDEDDLFGSDGPAEEGGDEMEIG